MGESDSESIGKSGILILLGTILSMGAGFVFKIALSNYLSGEDFGSVMLAVSIIGIVTIPTVLGLNQGVVKFISAANKSEKEDGYLSVSILLVSISSIIVSSILVIFNARIQSKLFDGSISKIFLFALVLCIPFASIVKILKGSLHGRMSARRYIGLSQIVQPLSRLVLGVSTSVIIGTAYSVMAGILLAYILTTIYGFRLLYKSGFSFQIGRDIETISMIKFSLPLIISSSVYILLTYFDRILIGYYMLPLSVGQYEVAMTIGMLLGLFHSAFSFLLFPKISELEGSDEEEEIPQIYAQTTKWILGCTTPAFMILLFRPNFLIGLFGQQYSVAQLQPIIAVISIGLFVDAVVGPNGQALLGFGRSRVTMYYNVIAVIINIILNIALIPNHGLVGAAVASLAGYLVMNGLKSIDLYLNHEISVVNWPSVKLMLSGTTISLPLLYFTTVYSFIIEFLYLSTVAFISIIMGFLVLALTGDITQEDRELIRMLVPVNRYRKD